MTKEDSRAFKKAQDELIDIAAQACLAPPSGPIGSKRYGGALMLGLVLLAANIVVAHAEDSDKTQRRLCQGKLITFHEVHFRVGKCEFTEGLPAGSIVLKACDNERGRVRGCEVIVETDANNVQHVISARVK